MAEKAGLTILNNNLDSDEKDSDNVQNTPSFYIGIGFYTALGVLLLAIASFLLYKIFSAFVDVAAPFVVGTIFALLLDPAVHRLEKIGIHRSLAIFVVFFVTVLFFAGLGALVVPRVVQQLGDIKQTGNQDIESWRSSIDVWLKHHQHLAFFRLPHNTHEILMQLSQQASTVLQGSAENLTEFLKGSATTLLRMIISLMVMVYVLADTKRLQGRALFLVPSKFRDRVHLFSHDIESVFSDYLRGLLIVCSCYGGSVIVVLYALSIWKHDLSSYALLAGICAGVLYSIPYVGALTIAGLMLAIGIHSGGMTFGIVTMFSVLACNQIFDNVITPKVLGGGVGLHPVTTLLALALGAQIGGFWGLVVAVPVVASIQAILFRIFPKLTSPTPESVLQSIHSDIAPSEQEVMEPERVGEVLHPNNNGG
jgi:predicted PurR-regulated permease PerM